MLENISEHRYIKRTTIEIGRELYKSLVKTNQLTYRRGVNDNMEYPIYRGHRIVINNSPRVRREKPTIEVLDDDITLWEIAQLS